MFSKVDQKKLKPQYTYIMKPEWWPDNLRFILPNRPPGMSIQAVSKAASCACSSDKCFNVAQVSNSKSFNLLSYATETASELPFEGPLRMKKNWVWGERAP